jgi:hypothetical protein
MFTGGLGVSMGQSFTLAGGSLFTEHEKLQAARAMEAFLELGRDGYEPVRDQIFIVPESRSTPCFPVPKAKPADVPHPWWRRLFSKR